METPLKRGRGRPRIHPVRVPRNVGGRPPKPPAEKMSAVVGFKLTPTDRDRLYRLATAAGRGVSEVLSQLAITWCAEQEKR